MTTIESRITKVAKSLDAERADRWEYSLEQLLGLAQGLTEEEVGPPARSLKEGQVGLEELILLVVPRTGDLTLLHRLSTVQSRRHQRCAPTAEH